MQVTKLHCTVLCWSLLYCNALCCTLIYFTLLQYTALQISRLYCNVVHCNSITRLHCTILPCTDVASNGSNIFLQSVGRFVCEIVCEIDLNVKKNTFFNGMVFWVKKIFSKIDCELLLHGNLTKLLCSIFLT